MNDIVAFLILLGGTALDALESTILVVIGAVVAVDLYVGWKRRPVLIFAITQVLGLAMGLAWAASVGIKQDVAGPYAWALVLGAWMIATVTFHLCYCCIRLWTKGTE